MNDYTLLVIDMQSNFDAANDANTIVSVLREIAIAKERGCGIIVMEYRNHPDLADIKSIMMGKNAYKDTHSPILDEIEDYNRATIVHKYECSGAFELRNFLLEPECCDFNIDKFKVCGVNTDACVACTVNDMWEYFPDAEFHVVRDACNHDIDYQVAGRFGSMWEGKTYNPFKAFNPDPRIKII